jgi:hypothetical protein
MMNAGRLFHYSPLIIHHFRPYGRTRVLPAVFSNSRNVPFDGAGIQRRLFKRRVRHLDQPVLTHQVHAVVPVTGSHEQQAVLAEFEAVEDGSDTVLKTHRLLRAPGQIVVVVMAPS